jgi:peptidyl-prolyl cis-trans isomerase A (cyclophilin A)
MNALRGFLGTVAIALAALLAPEIAAAGTIVRFTVNTGTTGIIDVELQDEAMPITVANFLGYVSAGAYDSTIFHRSTTYDPTNIQVVQGGGYALSGNQLVNVPTVAPIVLETGTLGNVRGTIAKARGAATDSATSQFYFNVQDNPGLDGNYAVFGSVIGSLATLDAIGSASVYDLTQQLGPAFAEMPLLQPSLDASSLVLVSSVQVVPEPSTLALAACGVGVAAVAAVRRRAARRGR